jgi:LDH2 family malate/lactate/ureidoglycolate dehydrogenase
MDRPQCVSHLVLSLDPARFGDLDGFARRMTRLAEAVLGAGDPGATRLPGARSFAAEQDHADTVELGPD